MSLEMAHKVIVRVRHGSDSSVSACCMAGPSSNLGSAPQRRPSTERKQWGEQEWHSTSIIYIILYVCSVNVKINEKSGSMPPNLYKKKSYCPTKKNYVPQFLKQRNINGYYVHALYVAPNVYVVISGHCGGYLVFLFINRRFPFGPSPFCCSISSNFSFNFFLYFFDNLFGTVCHSWVQCC